MCDNHPVTLHCIECGSHNVVKDAFAEWDDDTQKWVLSHIYDAVSCLSCGYESKSGEVERRIIPAI
jgi:predicted nucleic-acid-binding Zn-ribbon protein